MFVQSSQVQNEYPNILSFCHSEETFHTDAEFVKLTQVNRHQVKWWMKLKRIAFWWCHDLYIKYRNSTVQNQM